MQPVHDTVGKCSRLVNCGYHYTPSQYFKEQGNNIKPSFPSRRKVVPQKRVQGSIPEIVMLNSKKGNDHLTAFLTRKFPVNDIEEIKNRYHVGSSNHWPGATVFWQVDKSNNIRTGKVMLYNPDTGKRVKKPYNHITWMHSILKYENYTLQQCMFGEHLLIKEPAKTVGIVESEKTALIASLYFRDILWLALGGLQNLNKRVIDILKYRKVILYPDLNCHGAWLNKLKELDAPRSFRVSDLLEKAASGVERQRGLDLADYILKFKTSDFIQKKEVPVRDIIKKGYIYRLLSLIEYFETATIPIGPVKDTPDSTILDPEKYVLSHLQFALTYGDTWVGNTYLERIERFSKLLITNY
jgi:hypothetical protein